MASCMSQLLSSRRGSHIMKKNIKADSMVVTMIFMVEHILSRNISISPAQAKTILTQRCSSRYKSVPTDPVCSVIRLGAVPMPVVDVISSILGIPMNLNTSLKTRTGISILVVRTSVDSLRKSDTTLKSPMATTTIGHNITKITHRDLDTTIRNVLTAARKFLTSISGPPIRQTGKAIISDVCFVTWWSLLIMLNLVR